MKNNHKPEIRFPGYTGDWEQRKLGDISDIKTGPFGSTLHAKDYVENGTPIITTEHFKNGKLPLYKEGIPQVSDEDLERLKSYILNSEDIVFSRVGSVDINALVTEQQEGWLFSGRVLRVRSDEEINSQFLHYELSTDRVKNDVISRAVGQTMPSINTEILKETKVVIFNEKKVQEKIGNFFKEIDDLLTLHQQELTTLKQTKQGFLQKMFPKEGESVPEVRFPGFTGDWEQRRLDSMVDRLKSYPLSRDVETSDYTGYKYIHYGDIHTKVADKIDKSSNLPNIKVGNYELLEKGDLVLADASEDYKGIATPAVITIDTPYKLVSGLHTIALRPKQVDSLFLYYLINSPIFRKYGYRVGTGMKVFGISVTNLLKFESIFPSLEEQTKIGNFFEQLDNTIALHQRELDALKETKKAFLQKMFA